MTQRASADRLGTEAASLAGLRMRQEVLSGLSGHPKSIPSKYFYDEAGSRLFEEITRLDEYYLTRIERTILEDHLGEIAELLGEDVLVVEPGAGNGAKTRLLLERLERPAAYVPIDISGAFLQEAADRLRVELPGIPILPVVGDFTAQPALPDPPHPAGRRVVFFPGSTIGNFVALEACRLLRGMRWLAGAEGAVLVGFDLVKPVERLLAAYDDRSGVTARFNLNLLERLNRELGADFDLASFRHRAIFEPVPSRIEMHLVSTRSQQVRIDDRTFDFASGEPIVTEHCHKYTPDGFAELACAAGLRAEAEWTDPDRLFCVQLLVPVEE